MRAFRLSLFAFGFAIVLTHSPVGAAAHDVVLYAADSARVAGAWRREADASAAGGARLRHPNAGAAKLAAPLAEPSNHFEIAFHADAGVGYRVWMRARADADQYSNDSVFLQFSDSVNASGAAVYRIDSTSGSALVLEDASNAGLSGWGWADNGYGAQGPLIYFASTGTHTLRVQTREDGLAIDQIVLSADIWLHTAPGATKADSTILPPSGAAGADDVVMHAADIIANGLLVGDWSLAADSTAADGTLVGNPNRGAAKIAAPAASPASYFEFTFYAKAGMPYRLWMRGRAEADRYYNDSVFVQFSDSVSAEGSPVFRIGSTSGSSWILEERDGAGVSGWGWSENGYGSLGPLIRFATSGAHRIRVQVREDGLSIDQIVLSPSRFLSTPPGASQNDHSTPLPSSLPRAKWPNEPAGFKVLTDWGLDHALPTADDVPILGSPGWGIVGNAPPGSSQGWAELVSDPGAPFSPSNVYDFVYPQGLVEGEAPATVYYDLASDEVYAGFWWKPSSPFDSGPNGNKIAFLFNGAGLFGGQQFLILHPDGRLHILPEYPGDYRWRAPNVNATVVTLGGWHRIEWYSNVSSGTLKWWLDGVLQGSHSDVTNSYQFDTFKLSPTWGGNTGAQKRQTDHYWFDHLHLSVR